MPEHELKLENRALGGSMKNCKEVADSLLFIAREDDLTDITVNYDVIYEGQQVALVLWIDGQWINKWMVSLTTDDFPRIRGEFKNEQGCRDFIALNLGYVIPGYWDEALESERLTTIER